MDSDIATLTDGVISDELRTYGASATDQVCLAIRAYIPLLLRWNRRISLTTVTDPLQILRFHFGESMFASRVIANRNGRLADVGSGAGFPGIPLKLLIPTLDIVLIEPNAKKAAFLAEVVRELKLDSVEVYRGRFDGLTAGSGFDYITARALGMHEDLARWSREAVSVGGSLILWLGEEDAVNVSLQKSWRWSKPILIPGSHSRVLLASSAI
ncbi:MAG: 16S rRNA (guanine(527)-N(7))-methyltransferase RsmG [Candidatus Acidiferrales bacterium]